MNTFLRKLLVFSIFVPTVFLIGLLLPPTPLAKEYLLTKKPMKDSLLANVKTPRIIFVAGSSMAFGLDSQVFRDSLNRFPINTGLHGGMGLFYMLENTAKYVKKGDVVVVVAEYHQFYGNFADGGEQLLRALFDNSKPMAFFDLTKREMLKTYPYIPKYALSKFIPSEYINAEKEMNPVYSTNSFNKYGDATAHWADQYNKKNIVALMGDLGGQDFSHALVDAMVAFNNEMKQKGATVYISFPPFQHTSFNLCKNQIHYIEKQLRNTNLTIIGTPERFMMPDENIFDTAYHLNKSGVDSRTQLLLEDVKSQMHKDGIQ
jgi:hypothetical protein